MENSDTLKRESLILRLHLSPLQRRYMEAVWTPSNDLFISNVAYQIIDNLEEMAQDKLRALVELLEHDSSTKEVARVALVMVIKNASDGDLYIWSELMSRHFLWLDNYVPNNDDEYADIEKLDMINALVHYTKTRSAMTFEQERILLRLTASGLEGGNPAMTIKTPLHLKYVIEDNDVINYVLAHGDQVDVIAQAMVNEKLFRAAQIEAYVTGLTPSLSGGAL